MTSDFLTSIKDAARLVRSSTSEFDGGGQYRVEIPSVEGPETFEHLLAVASREDVTIHRASQGSGIALLRDEEILRYVELGAAANVEVCLFVGPRAPWTGESASALTPDGKFFGWRHMSVDTLHAAYDDVVRATELGLRSILVADEGLTSLIETARTSGALPHDLVVKASAMLGICNPAGSALAEQTGVNSINLPSDTSIGNLAAHRHVLTAPIDIYIEAPDSLGGFTRYHDIGEIVRVAAPVYLKFGLKNAPHLYPSGRHLTAQATASASERLRRAQIGLERLARQYPAAKPAPLEANNGVPVVHG